MSLVQPKPQVVASSSCCTSLANFTVSHNCDPELLPFALSLRTRPHTIRLRRLPAIRCSIVATWEEGLPNSPMRVSRHHRTNPNHGHSRSSHHVTNSIDDKQCSRPPRSSQTQVSRRLFCPQAPLAMTSVLLPVLFANSAFTYRCFFREETALLWRHPSLKVWHSTRGRTTFASTRVATARHDDKYRDASLKSTTCGSCEGGVAAILGRITTVSSHLSVGAPNGVDRQVHMSLRSSPTVWIFAHPGGDSSIRQPQGPVPPLRRTGQPTYTHFAVEVGKPFSHNALLLTAGLHWKVRLARVG